MKAPRVAAIAATTLAATTVAVTCIACARRPLVVTEPASVVAERGKHPPPQRVVQWYADFWRAILNLTLPVAWTLADTRDERRLADALQSMENGDFAEADSTVSTLLTSSDTLVRNAARVTYGALLSSRSEWERLATYARAPHDAGGIRDAAGVEVWASAFSTVRTTSAFTDSVVQLPLMRTATGAPIVAVRVNGRTRYFWIDTGSSISILSSTTAAECGVEPVGADTLELLTSVGRIPARPAVLSSLVFGPLTLRHVPSMVVDTANFTLRNDAGHPGNTAATRIDGVIGFDIIRRVDLTIDDARQRVVVRRPTVRSIDRRRHPRNLFWFGVPIVTLVTERGTTVHFSLDTGAEETYGTRSLVPKAGAHVVAAERRVVHGFGSAERAQGLVVPRLRLFVDGVPLLFQRVFLYDARYPTMFELDGTLGSDAGRGGTVRIDMTNGQFEIGPS